MNTLTSKDVMIKDVRLRYWIRRRKGLSDVQIKIAFLILGFVALASVLTLFVYAA